MAVPIMPTWTKLVPSVQSLPNVAMLMHGGKIARRSPSTSDSLPICLEIVPS